MTRASDIEKPQKFIEIQLRRLMLVFVIFQIFSDSDRCRTCIGECVGQVHGRGAASGNKNAWPVGSVGSRVGVSDPDKAIGSYVEAEHLPSEGSIPTISTIRSRVIFKGLPTSVSSTLISNCFSLFSEASDKRPRTNLMLYFSCASR